MVLAALSCVGCGSGEGGGGGGGGSSDSATLTWDPPTTNADGTPITDLAGYKIYYGSSIGSLTAPIDAGNVTTYTFTGLPTGTYCFAITAYDISKNESDYSNIVSKTMGTGDIGSCP